MALPGSCTAAWWPPSSIATGIATAADAGAPEAGREVGEVPTPRYVTAALHVNTGAPPPGVELEVRAL